jgi:hypothetical protein
MQVTKLCYEDLKANFITNDILAELIKFKTLIKKGEILCGLHQHTQKCVLVLK